MAKYSNKFKRDVVNYYFTSQSGYVSTANHFGIERTSVRRWVNNYKERGSKALNTINNYPRYSTTFKMQVIKAILEEGLSFRVVSNRFNLSNTGTVSQW